MLIVSSFRDYYDTAMTYGVDKDCVYNRETKEFETDKFRLPYSKDNVRLTRDIIADFKPIFIGFCGKIYPVIKIEYHYVHPTYPKDEFIFDIRTAKDNLRRFGVDITSRTSFWGNGYIDSTKGLEDFFNGDHRNLESLFTEHHTPIFAIERSNGYRLVKITINPNLKSFQFVKFKDPASAFQEIYQYIAGVLGNKEVDIVKISDMDMLKQKGFDKYSFKTMKGDKKPRAKNRGKNE